MATQTLTMALERYDRHLPFMLGLVEPPEGLSIDPKEVGMVPPRRDGVDRHRRALVDLEFDIAEVSLSSYIIARQRGVPMTAVPTVPRRLFSQNHIFVNADAGIDTPADLIGKRIAIWAFQVTMSVLAKGDLQDEYGVPWREVTWVCQRPEEIASDAGAGVIETMPEGRTGADMLLAGEVDAYIDPHPPEEVFTDPRSRRLFPDTPSECRRYWKKHGYYPMMHLLAVKDEAIAARPDLPAEVMRMWDDATEQAHEFYVDHNYTVMPFGRYEFLEEMSSFDGDLWPSGLAANRACLERFIGFMVDQELLPEAVPVETLFHESVLGT